MCYIFSVTLKNGFNRLTQLFEFNNYKVFLRAALNTRAKTQRGVRSRFAEALGCRSGYVTQVLNGKSDLSLEQGNLACDFFGLTDEESEFFLLLLIHGRAGSRHLQSRIEKQISRARENRLNLKNRFNVKSISLENQTLFYSNWQYLAVLTALSVPQLQTKETLGAYLNLPQKRVAEIIEAMEHWGLIVFKNGKYQPGIYRTHLGKDSPMLAKHHINWRIQALQSIERQSPQDLHYSSVVSLSEKDALLAKEKLAQSLEEVAAIVAPSPEEKVCSLCLDFFDLGQTSRQM